MVQMNLGLSVKSYKEKTKSKYMDVKRHEMTKALRGLSDDCPATSAQILLVIE